MKFKFFIENSDDVIVFVLDGGYVWVILVCSFYSSFCMEGLIVLFGFLLFLLMREFKVFVVVVLILNFIFIGIFLVLGLLYDILWKILLWNVLKYWFIKIYVCILILILMYIYIILKFKRMVLKRIDV